MANSNRDIDGFSLRMPVAGPTALASETVCNGQCTGLDIKSLPKSFHIHGFGVVVFSCPGISTMRRVFRELFPPGRGVEMRDRLFGFGQARGEVLRIRWRIFQIPAFVHF